MNGDLISREELKNHKFVGNKFVQIGGRTNGKTLRAINQAYQQGWNDAIDAIIDNAPTVEVEPEKIAIANVSFDENKLKEIVKTEVIDKIKNGEWIPVSERLPEDMQRVLIWFEYYRYGDFNCMYQTYGFGYVCDGKWSPFINGETGWQDYRVIAWQPLPKPYEKGGAE